MKRSAWAFVFVLCLAAVAFAPGLKNGFVSWDDPRFITENESIRSLSFASVGQMFTRAYDGNYIPFTILSFALNHAWFGLDPAAYHATNLVLHLLNVWLVFLLFRRLGVEPPTAVLAAALFALHPLRVESVSWATERKDVLFAAFYLGALVVYAGHRRENEFPWTVLVLYIAALLSKPMAITLPAALLLLDHWRGRRDFRVLLRGLIPFGAVALAFAFITVLSQLGANAVRRDPITALLNRPFLAANSLLFYLKSTFWPIHLSSLHPYPEKFSPEMMWALPLALALITVCALAARRVPVVGYAGLFFIATLAPVLNVVPAGGQMMADRFTYIPSLAPSLLIALGLSRAWKSSSGVLRGLALAVALASPLTLGAMTYQRCGVWKNDEAMWTDCLRAQPDSYVALINLGNYYHREKRDEEAAATFSRAVEIWPNVADAYYNRALASRDLGRADEALADLDRAAERDPGNANIFLVRAGIRAARGLSGDALADYARALSLKPAWPELYAGRGTVLFDLGRFDEARVDFESALRLAPGNEEYQQLLARARNAAP